MFSLSKRLNKIRERILFLLEPLEKERISEIAKELSDTGNYFDKIEIMEKSISIVRNEINPLKQRIFQSTEFNLLKVYKNLFKKLQLMESLSEKNLPQHIKEIRDYTLEAFQRQYLIYELV